MKSILCSTPALALIFFSVSCSSSLGDVPFDLLAEGVVEPLPCADRADLRMVDRCDPHPIVGRVSALEAIDVLDETASSALGVERTWTGILVGVGIARDGRNLENGLSGWSTSWISGSAEDPDMLVFDTTAGVCRVQNRCSCVSGGTCPGFDPADVGGVHMPAVDSGAAILAAFPDDPEDVSYDLAWDGQSGRWTINRTVDAGAADAGEGDDALAIDAAEGADSVAD